MFSITTVVTDFYRPH